MGWSLMWMRLDLERKKRRNVTIVATMNAIVAVRTTVVVQGRLLDVNENEIMGDDDLAHETDMKDVDD